VLTAEFLCDARAGQARFAFDVPGNYVLTENDDARWLIGDALETSPVAPVRDDLQQVRERRLAPVEDEEPTIPVVTHVTPEPAAPEAPAAPAARNPAPAAPAARTHDEVPLGEAPARSANRGAEGRPDQRQPEPAAEADEPARKPAPKNKRGRASVPSWDEIMFGGPSER
jgi:hypothetical protein